MAASPTISDWEGIGFVWLCVIIHLFIVFSTTALLTSTKDGKVAIKLLKIVAMSTHYRIHKVVFL